MTEGIIVALITGGFAVAGHMVIAWRSSNDLYNRLDKQSEMADQRLELKLDEYRAVTDTKIDSLAAEVRKHNSFAHRIPVIEAKVEALEKAAARQ